MNNDKAKAEILDKCSQSVECLARGKVLDLVGTLDAAQTSPVTASAELQDIADDIEQSDGIALMLTGTSKQLGIRRTAMVIAALRAAGHAPTPRITGATDIVDEAACLIWAELCPGMVMGDADRTYYENAAKAVLALSSTIQKCDGCDGHECDNGCAYPGAVSPPEGKS